MTTATASAGDPHGALPVGVTADEEMLSPHGPPLPLEPPTVQQAKEAIGIGELKHGRAIDKPMFEKQSPEFHEREQRVRMHAVRAEWVLNLRRGLRHLTELEMLDDVASLMDDPPSASPAVYMDLFVKFQTLAAENSGRPVGAPMLGDWLAAIGDQWLYAEPPVCLGPTWGETVDASEHFDVPYDVAIKRDSVHNLGPLTPGEAQGDTSMQQVSGKRHDHKCITPGAAIRAFTKGNYRAECYTIHNGATCDDIADELEYSYPGIKKGEMQNVMCSVTAGFDGFCKPVSSRGLWRGALRPGETHGRGKVKWDDTTVLQTQLKGAMRLAKVMSMFRWASFSCAGKGSIWGIDNNENLSSYDGGKQWDIWTAMALSACKHKESQSFHVLRHLEP